MDQDKYLVEPINKKDTHWLLLNVHYAKRIPPMSYAFGLFLVTENERTLKGVVTYGMPASPALCRGVCGESWKKDVLELNRLCLIDNQKNEASRLVGASLKLLPKPKIIVSYADSSQNHVGFVYQSTNFIYTGITAKRTEWTVRGMEHMHTKAIGNTVKHLNKPPLQALKEIHGDNFYYRDRSQKHRYIYFIGDKHQKKQMIDALKYPVLKYPKPQKEG